MRIMEWKSQFRTSSHVDHQPEGRTQRPIWVCWCTSGMGFLIRWSPGTNYTLTGGNNASPPLDMAP